MIGEWENGQLLVDREGRVWEVCRDGGMVARAKFSVPGGIESAGIAWLVRTYGPVKPFDAKAWYEEQP